MASMSRMEEPLTDSKITQDSEADDGLGLHIQDFSC